MQLSHHIFSFAPYRAAEHKEGLPLPGMSGYCIGVPVVIKKFQNSLPCATETFFQKDMPFSKRFQSIF